MTAKGSVVWHNGGTGLFKSHGGFVPGLDAAIILLTNEGTGLMPDSVAFWFYDKVLGNPSFVYRGEWKSENGAVLEFETTIDGITINGVDIITFDENDRITHFKVMVRPLKAMNLLHRLMGEELMRQTDAAKSQSASR